ncbi:MAG: TIGR03960 family B12-binding radical SAM protein [Candidatus Omnitrophota bacterium]
MLFKELLLEVHKPGRYIGHEWNVSRKDLSHSMVRFALCFPDLYEVGMSNLGMRIIYGLLNSLSDVSCERFFSCDTDMEEVLRKGNLNILSLESASKMDKFDLLGFSLGCELNYTNILTLLDLGGIPLKSNMRENFHPLVIGGGPCSLNPEPIHDFFDLFVIGEGEEVILEIIDVYRKQKNRFKSGEISRQDMLGMLSAIEGVYAPSLYVVEYNSLGNICGFFPRIPGLPKRIKKRFVKDLNTSYFPEDWLVPYIQIVHDRLTLEIMRGCPNRCRFCQARQQYFPFRTRQAETVLNMARNAWAKSGYEEISLCGLSVSDHPQMEELLSEMVGLFRSHGVGISLPSIKPKSIVGGLSSLIATIKKTGLTFAPEAASERMRKIISKDFDMQDFHRAIEQAYVSGYQHIKLYFMIGLPYEEEADLDAIISFAADASELRRKIKGRPAQVNISINTLIPRPHTPFQWFPMAGLDDIKARQHYIKKKSKNNRLKISFHDPYMSFLEGVFARGDRRLSEVILSAFNKGARFDAWSKRFMFSLWQEAFMECKIDPGFYLRARPADEILPWDFIDIGISRESLVDDAGQAALVKTQVLQ